MITANVMTVRTDMKAFSMKSCAGRLSGAFVLILALLADLVTPAPAATLLPNGKQQFVDQNGAPLAAGSVQFYVPNSTTPKNTWQDAGQTILNTNPISLDIAGRAVIYGAGCYRQVVKDRSGNTIWDSLTCDTSALSILWAARSAGTANTQTITASNFTQTDGQTVAFIAGLTNTGPTTLVINGTTGINVLKDTQTGSFSLSGAEIIAGNLVQAVYDASRGAFHLLTSNPFVGSNPISTISGSGTTDIGALPSRFANITGSATITSLGSSASTNFPFYTITFSGTSTLVNSAASLILPSGQNIQTQAGDYATAVYLGSGNWQVINYSRIVAQATIGGSRRLVVRNDTVSPNTKVDITADAAVIPNAQGYGVQATGISIVVDTSCSGAVNCMDAGTLPASSWVYIYLISNGATTGGLISASPSAPILPAGYIFSSRIGALRADGSSNFYRTLQNGNETRYIVTASTNTAGLPILASGTAGSPTAPTWVLIPTATVAATIPPTATNVLGLVGSGNNTIIVAPSTAYGAAVSTTNPPPIAISSGNLVSRANFDMAFEAASTIYWACDAGTGLVVARGWRDSVPAN